MRTNRRGLVVAAVIVGVLVGAGCAEDQTATVEPTTTRAGTTPASGAPAPASGSKDAVPAVKAHLRSQFGAEPWYAGLFGAGSFWGSREVGDVSEWAVTMAGVPGDEGADTADVLAVCDSMAAFLDVGAGAGGVDLLIELKGPTPVVTRAPGEACVAA